MRNNAVRPSVRRSVGCLRYVDDTHTVTVKHTTLLLIIKHRGVANFPMFEEINMWKMKSDCSVIRTWSGKKRARQGIRSYPFCLIFTAHEKQREFLQMILHKDEV